MKFQCTNYKRVGFMVVKSGKIDITDPGYDDDSWCGMHGVTVKPGKYYCYVSALKGAMAKEWGKRIVSMLIVHADADTSKPLGFNEIGSVGVDAGLMSISESGIKPNYSESNWMECMFHLDELEKNCKNGLDAFVSTKFSLGKKPKKQFWSSTGFGDGMYGVYSIDSHDQSAAEYIPDAVMVEFITPFDD